MVHLQIKIKSTVLEWEKEPQIQKQLLKISTRGQCNSMWKGNIKIPLERRAGLFFFCLKSNHLILLYKTRSKIIFCIFGMELSKSGGDKIKKDESSRSNARMLAVKKY